MGEGKIVDIKNNKPIESVAIYINKTSVATYSNEQGDFSLNIPITYFHQNNFLSIRMFGYEEMIFK